MNNEGVQFNEFTSFELVLFYRFIRERLSATTAPIIIARSRFNFFFLWKSAVIRREAFQRQFCGNHHGKTLEKRLARLSSTANPSLLQHDKTYICNYLSITRYISTEKKAFAFPQRSTHPELFHVTFLKQHINAS